MQTASAGDPKGQKGPYDVIHKPLHICGTFSGKHSYGWIDSKRGLSGTLVESPDG